MTRLTLHWVFQVGDIHDIEFAAAGRRGLELAIGLTLSLSIARSGFVELLLQGRIFSFLFSRAHFFFWWGGRVRRARKVGNFAIMGPRPRLLGVTS